MPITGLPSWAAQDKVKPSKFNLYKSILEAKFAAGITSADISPTAGIQGTQLSVAPGQRITVNNIEDGAVTGIKLKHDATGVDGAINSADIVTDRILPNDKIVLASLTQAELNISVHEVTFSFSASAGVSAALTRTAQSVDPTSTFPVADYSLIGCYVKKDPAGAANPVAMIGYPDGSGTNWAGRVVAYNDAAAPLTASGTLVYTFLRKS